MRLPNRHTGPDSVHAFADGDTNDWAADVGQPRRIATGRGRSDAARFAFSLRRLSERAAATRPLTGGASVAVAGNVDRLARELGVEQVGEMCPRVAIVFERQIQHLVEITIVDIAPPIDGDEISAHHVLEIGVEMSLAQQIDVAIELALGDKDRAEALNRHVCKRIEPVERDAVTLAEHALVIGLQRLLRRRQRWPLWIIDKIEYKPGFGVAITQFVEASKSAQRTFEHSLATLAIHVVFEIARHGCGDLDLLAGKELGEILLSGHFEDRQIAAIHHLHVHLARGAHQLAEVRIEFRRAAGDVERRYALASEEREYDVDHLARHFLGAVRTGVDMAMHAGLVAAIAKIDLQRVEPSPSDRGKGDLLEQWPGVAHRARPTGAKRNVAQSFAAVTSADWLAGNLRGTIAQWRHARAPSLRRRR